MTYFTKQTPSVKIWNSFPVLFCLDICPPPPRVLKADERRASRERSKTLSILMFLKWAGCKIVKNSKCIWGVLQMLNLAGAWHLLLSLLPLIPDLKHCSSMLKKPHTCLYCLPKGHQTQEGVQISKRTKISLLLDSFLLVCLYKLRHWLSLMSLFSGKYPGEDSRRSKNIIYRCNELRAGAGAGS